jgi:hypothetical protein
VRPALRKAEPNSTFSKKNQAISAFIKDDFKNETLGDLAFDTGTGFHFYDFYKATKSPYGYSDAFT